MRVSRLWISIVVVILVLGGCGKKESNSNLNMMTENETDKETYELFLMSEIPVMKSDNKEYWITDLLESTEGKYLYCDIDGDGTDELHIKSDRAYFIIKEQKDGLCILYEGSAYEEPVNQNGLRGILYFRQGGAPTHDSYQYFTIDSEGTNGNRLEFEWYDDNENELMDSGDVYIFNNENIGEEEWKEKTALYRGKVGITNEWCEWKEELQIESYTYPTEFTLNQNLNKAITELALMYDEFDLSKTKEDTYPTIFISHYCQNSRLSYDYLEKMREENNGILLEEHVRYIQYSLTKENVDFQNNIPLEGIDINQASSGLGFGKILSYEVEEEDEEVHLVAKFERGADGSSNTNLYELSVVLVKNPQSCFDGYSIKSLSSQDITPIITGDNKEHTFWGCDMEIEENGIFIFENYGGEDDVQYARHIEIDLSTNPTLAEFIRKNAGKEYDVTYIWDDTMTQPVYRVVPVSITLHGDYADE